MIFARRFDPYGEHPFRGWTVIVLISALFLLVLTAPGVTVEPTTGVSGEVYSVYEEHQVWRAVGPVLSIRFRTDHRVRSSIESEVRDLLPLLTARADSAELRYVLIRANRPIIRIGHRFGVYTGWNFRYERSRDGWIPSGYW